MKETHTPRIIPRSDHPISRAMLSPNALKTLYRLRDNGHTAWLVGGCVRDLLLGREPKDFDVATDAVPGRIKKLFRNCRLVGRRFRLAHLHFRDEIIEVSTFRAHVQGEDDAVSREAGADGDAGTGSSRDPRRLVSEEGVVLRDNVFGTPAEDALRRDFTVNALAYDIADFSIIDFVGGMEDLRDGVIRTIGDPGSRFTEDPVRMLRAVRFAALLGFEIEDATWRAVVENAPSLTLSTPPRLYEEVLKLFLSGEGERTYQLMRRGGLFAPLFPGLDAWLAQETEGFPHAGIGRNLEWVDRRISSGEKVSPPLLLSLMFGEYLEEEAARLRGRGFPPQEAMDGAVAAFLGAQAPLVAIPHRVGVGVRGILTLQNRLRRIPGKRPESVPARSWFPEALAYLRCQCEGMGGDAGILAWWERFARENAISVGEKQADAPKARHGRRRRRGKKKNRTGD
ncbi:MAG: polynucleotide adenylyltransferase PcnB [Geobacteraceae bacterium]|nr:polynucleotide adenylyltransferase PcnB [Geobacteraceae bacterium]